MSVIMKDKIDWKGCKYSLEVHDEKNFDELKNITQVYGFVFDDSGRILIIRTKGGEWCLPGGTPENYDVGWEDTLIREVDEEANVDITHIRPAGYLLSKALGKEFKPKAGVALRAVAEIGKIKKRAADPATGSINERKFVDSKDFLKYCKWGENGKVQLDLALAELN